MKSFVFFISACTLAAACDKPRQKLEGPVTFSDQSPLATGVPPAPTPAPLAPTVPPQPTPEALPPVAPGQYVNHVGNPVAGHWGPDGQWVWKDPESKEANDTWKYLAAAGAGAAGGAAISYMLSKKHFEQKNPEGSWRREANIHDEHTYRDKYGKPISAAEYERRRAQSEKDKATHRAASQQYRDKKGRFISREEYERRKAQSAHDKARQRPRSSSKRRR